MSAGGGRPETCRVCCSMVVMVAGVRGKYRARHFILHTPVTCVSRAEQARQNCPRVKTFIQDIHRDNRRETNLDRRNIYWISAGWWLGLIFIVSVGWTWQWLADWRSLQSSWQSSANRRRRQGKVWSDDVDVSTKTSWLVTSVTSVGKWWYEVQGKLLKKSIFPMTGLFSDMKS